MTKSAGQRPANLAGGPLLWCLLAAALFGASTPASKPLLETLSPLKLSGVLYLGAAIAVLPRALKGTATDPQQSERAKTGGKHWWRLAGAVVFGGIIGPVLLLTGLSLASAASVALWLNLETVATAVLGRFFFKEHLAATTWLAVLLVVLASALLSPGTPAGGPALALVALACVAWGLDNNLTSVIDDWSPAEVTLAKGAIAGVVNLGLGFWLDPSLPAVWVVAAALLLGALSYGASLLLYISGAQQLGATRSQLIFSTAPLWGLGLAWLALGEALGWAHLISATLMGLAVWLWHRERHEHGHSHARVTHSHWHRHDDGHHAHAHATGSFHGGWHYHEHTHEPVEHSHPHRPDLHHRHQH